MNNLRNKVQLIGHLGHDVEIKKLENGGMFARVSLGTKEFKNFGTGETKVETQWHQLVGWGRLAENMQVLFKKGKQVAIEGKLSHRTYEDKNGIKRYISEVVVKEFVLMA